MIKQCVQTLLLLLLSGSLAFAEPGAAQTQVAEKPDVQALSKTPISVQVEGSDSLGARLSMRLRERFNQSSLFALKREEQQDQPQLVLLVTTLPEFASRPSVGSIYSVCWVFKQGKGFLPLLLKQSVGVFAAEDVESVIDTLLERTDALASRYMHLWNKK